MKKLVFFLLLLFSAQAYAQHYRKEPSKADNTVIVHDVTLDSAVKKVQSLGYVVRFADKENAITGLNPENMEIHMKVLKDGNIGISAKYTLEYISGTPDLVEVSYAKGGANGKRWKDLMKFAGEFSNIEYTRK
jgi:hypothetical protein